MYITTNWESTRLGEEFAMYLEQGQGLGLTKELKRTLENMPNFISVHKVKRVIFNPPATIIMWSDNTKSVVKCQDGEPFDPEKGFVLAYLKKLLGNDNTFNKEIHKWVKYEEPVEEKNEPLTTEELMKMDGQRVWCNNIVDGADRSDGYYSHGWYIVDVKNNRMNADTDSSGGWWFIHDNGMECGFRAYRKKKEVSANE